MTAAGLATEETARHFSPLGLQIIDSFLNAAPIAAYNAHIDLFDGAQWQATALRPTRTPGGVLTLPGVGRRPVVLPGDPSVRYRLRIDSANYIPSYRQHVDGFEFLVPPYNDTNPLNVPPANLGLLSLDPSAAYPYPAEFRVLRGIVTEVDQKTPVRDATVAYAVGQVEAMTGADGYFALGLRRAPLTGQVAIDVHHYRTNRVSTVSVTLPTALQTKQLMVLN
jgi:hypothetical protein